MLTIALTIAGTMVAYRGLLAATRGGTEGSLRARTFQILGGGPGPFRPK